MGARWLFSPSMWQCREYDSVISGNTVGSSENVWEKFPRWDRKQCRVCCHLTVITRHCCSWDPFKRDFRWQRDAPRQCLCPSHARSYHPEGKSHPKKVQRGFGEWRLLTIFGDWKNTSCSFAKEVPSSAVTWNWVGKEPSIKIQKLLQLCTPSASLFIFRILSVPLEILMLESHWGELRRWAEAQCAEVHMWYPGTPACLLPLSLLA